MDHVVTQGFLKPKQRHVLPVDADAATLLERLASYCSEAVAKRMLPSKT